MFRATRDLYRIAGKRNVPNYGTQSPVFAAFRNLSRGFATQGATRSVLRSTKFARVATGTLVVAAGAYYVDTYHLSATGYRSVKAFGILMWIAWEYSRNLESYEDPEDLHEATSEALLQLLMENKGLYIKLGQAIANQGSIFPIAYQKRFSRLYDEAPETSWEKVDEVLRQELGNDYDQIVKVDKKPVASASIAQVHRGRLSSGEDVAVKVQHHYMSKQIVADLFMYRLIARVYEYVFELPMTQFTRYVLEEMRHETSFLQEAKNGDKLALLVAQDPSARNLNVHVPRTFPDVLTDRVLVTEWIDGISMVSRKKLEDAGYDVATTMNQYLSLFGKQFFRYGFVHSDPHPGNMLVRFDSKGKQQLVILDHGLYITLPPKFQAQFRDLWQYIFSLDRQGMKQISDDWGIGSTPMFTSMITLKAPEGDSGEPFVPPRPESAKDLFKDFLSDEKRFPMELLFLMRTQRMMQNLNLQMGSPVNRVNTLTKELINTSLARRQDWASYVTLWRIKVVLLFSDIVFWAFRVRQYFSGRHDASDGIERYLVDLSKRTSQAMGFEVYEDPDQTTI